MLLSHGATAVYLFGSRATDNSRPGSDIDLAVRGIPPRKFFRAMGDLFELLEGPADVVDLDEDTPFVRLLQTSGKLMRVA